MMRSTDQLKDEHRVIEHVLAFYQAVASAAHAGCELPVDSLRDALEFTQSFADRFHHAKEEGVLFERLEKAGMPHQGGPVGVMLMEHEEGRSHVAALAEALERYAGGDKSAAGQIGEAAQSYADLLSQHIYKEDNILYVMAEQMLSAEDEQMLEAYGAADQGNMSDERKQHFVAVAERLGQEAKALQAAAQA